MDAGPLERRHHQNRPPRYEYVLTMTGRSRHPVLMDWRAPHPPRTLRPPQHPASPTAATWYAPSSADSTPPNAPPTAHAPARQTLQKRHERPPPRPRSRRGPGGGRSWLLPRQRRHGTGEHRPRRTAHTSDGLATLRRGQT
ncbi:MULTISPECIES: hypothetical protein [unclassified Streptomyces]|uniref:hypothetical protein n=1 Tax=unclassified Streptomyces TaxID=2593676 RepID=UPI003D8E121D